MSTEEVKPLTNTEGVKSATDITSKVKDIVDAYIPKKTVLEIIKNRRSIDPDDFNGEMISREIIEQMLEAGKLSANTRLYRTLAFCNF